MWDTGSDTGILSVYSYGTGKVHPNPAPRPSPLPQQATGNSTVRFEDTMMYRYDYYEMGILYQP